jgi:beta-N-acetylhexosaminidase
LIKKLIRIITISILVLLAGCMPQTGRNNSGDASLEPTRTTQPPANTTSPAENMGPSGKPEPTEDPDKKFKEVLRSMTLDEKLGQLLVVGYPSNEHAQKAIREYKVGGIVLFSRNFETFDQLYQITSQLKEYSRESKLPLWIALDEEGGTVSRLPAGKTPVPGARTVGSLQDLELTKSTGRVIGEEMAAAGANLDFAPVVDVVDNPENTFMLKRSYGNTPDMVSSHGKAFLAGLREAGILGCAKHYPGHGGTVVDSHKGMPVIPASLEEWRQKDAIPFQAMSDAGVDMIMVGHLSYPNIDPSGLPASMSKVFIQEQLRDRMGYKGLIITDDVEMQGYPQGEDRREAIITSFLAGVDLFAIGHTPEIQLDVLEALKDGINSGRITQERIDASVLRIIKAKSGLKNTQQYSLEEAKRIFGSKEHQAAIAPLLNNQ